MIVIFGPSLRILVTATQTPTSAATIGMNHTSDRRVRLFGHGSRFGYRRSGLSRSIMCTFYGPLWPLADGRGSQISRGSNDSTASIVSTTTAAKKNSPGPGSTDIERLELDQGGREGVDEHVDHRPASDELDHPVQPDRAVRYSRPSPVAT